MSVHAINPSAYPSYLIPRNPLMNSLQAGAQGTSGSSNTPGSQPVGSLQSGSPGQGLQFPSASPATPPSGTPSPDTQRPLSVQATTPQAMEAQLAYQFQSSSDPTTQGVNRQLDENAGQVNIINMLA